jgi:hypothetical protein
MAVAAADRPWAEEAGAVRMKVAAAAQIGAVEEPGEANIPVAAAQGAECRPALEGLTAPEELSGAVQELGGQRASLQEPPRENRTLHRSGHHPAFYYRIERKTFQHLLARWKPDPTIGVLENQADPGARLVSLPAER